jgi:hypothetical protein
MHRRIKLAFLAATAATATLTSLGLAGATGASAAASGPLVITTSYDQGFAGYVTGGSWRFRYVAASVPMAKTQTPPGNNGLLRIALSSNVATQVAYIDLRSGGGPGSVTFASGGHAGQFNLSPSVGDVMRISVYHNAAASRDELVATNTASGRTVKVTFSTPAVTYRHATLGVYIPNEGVTPPPANVRLWVFRNADETSYNGTHGTLFGPWPTVKFIDTTTGTVGGNVVMYPTNPSNSGHNFGVWLKGTS